MYLGFLHLEAHVPQWKECFQGHQTGQRPQRWCLPLVLPRKLLTHHRSYQGYWVPWSILLGMCTESRHRGRGFLRLPWKTLFISPLGCHGQLPWARVQEPAPPSLRCTADSMCGHLPALPGGPLSARLHCFLMTSCLHVPVLPLFSYCLFFPTYV